MANTTEDKLRLLSNNKISIKNAIISAGVSVPESTPLSGYANLIKSIKAISESTTTEDLLTICDLFDGIYSGEYTEHTYSPEEQEYVNSLLNLITGEV